MTLSGRRTMNHTHDGADKTLPLTAEIGSEGGSYADSTMQVATFADDRGLPAVSERTVGPGTEPASEEPAWEPGMIRYPTEPPPEQEQRMSLRFWRRGLVAVAAGAALGLAAGRWRRR
jgi:hypothetical protein